MIQALPEAEDTRAHVTDNASTRVRRVLRRWGALAVVALLATALGVVNMTQSRSTEVMHLRNPNPDGAMALAEVLEDRGVRVEMARQLIDLQAVATPDSTLFIPSPADLTFQEWDEIALLPGDLVIAGTPYVATSRFTPAITSSPQGTTSPVQAECSEPDASAASRISPFTGSVTPGADGFDVAFCFPAGFDTYGYAVWEQDGRTIRYIADRTLLMNRQLASDGNAALGFRALGHHAHLVWYQPMGYGEGTKEYGLDILRPLPPSAGPILLLVAGLTALVALWRGRRMGPVVSEALPVVVKPGEAVHGRGRLYHRVGSTGHASAGLRAGTARRLAQRLGLTRAAAPHDLVAAIAAASGRHTDNVGELLYGPPPTTAASLVRLAAELEKLEESVS